MSSSGGLEAIAVALAILITNLWLHGLVSSAPAVIEGEGSDTTSIKSPNYSKEKWRFAMAQANEGRASANGVEPQINGAAPQMNGAGNLAAGLAVANVAGALDPNAPVHARLDIEAVLLGPLPTKNNLSCEILPKITNEIWP